MALCLDGLGSWLSDGCRADVVDETAIAVRCDHQASIAVVQVTSYHSTASDSPIDAVTFLEWPKQ